MFGIGEPRSEKRLEVTGDFGEIASSFFQVNHVERKLVFFLAPQGRFNAVTEGVK